MGLLAEMIATDEETPPPQIPEGPQTTRIEGPHNSTSVQSILAACNHNPDKVRFQTAPAVYKKMNPDGTTAFTTYRYKLEAIPPPTNVEELIARAKEAKPHKAAEDNGAHWMVFQAGDQQIGKRSRDGSTEQIVERYLDSVQNAVDEYKHLKRLGIEGIQICLPGDCIEGVVSQGGKNVWLTQETITEQFRILRRLMLATVEAFAPLTDRIYFDTVNGNHDQAQRQMNTYPGDGWATESAIAVRDALGMNSAAYGHVEVRVPDKWSGSMTVPVGSTMVTVAHGNQWSRGKGLDWLRDQDFGHQDARGTQILQHGHEHEWSTSCRRNVMRICSDTYDMGSDWFREKRGADARRGGLVYLLRDGDASRMSLV